MKKLVHLSLVFIILLIAACSKNGSDVLVPMDPPAQNPSPGNNDTLAAHFAKATFAVSAPFNGKPQEGSLLLIRIPVKEKTTISFRNLNTNEFKVTKWFIDGIEQAGGNNFETTFNEIGQHTVTLKATSVSTGREFSKTSIIYVYKYISISVETIRPNYVCGQVEIVGTTPVGTLSKLTGTIDCANPANLSFGPLQLPIFSDTNSLLFIHLFKADTSAKILIPYASDTFSGGQLNNYTPGTYTSGATRLTIH